jgi:transposase
VTAGNVVIGMDPHKRSATIEVMSRDEAVLGGGRYPPDAAGDRAMVTYAKRWPDRRWAIEGSNGAGRHIAIRLVADGETVVDVPAKLSARARVFVSGPGGKTDAWDAALGSRWSAPARVGCIRSLMTSSAHCCGFWSTGAARSGRTTPA